jgi:hypothetical protein
MFGGDPPGSGLTGCVRRNAHAASSTGLFRRRHEGQAEAGPAATRGGEAEAAAGTTAEREVSKSVVVPVSN